MTTQTKQAKTLPAAMPWGSGITAAGLAKHAGHPLAGFDAPAAPTPGPWIAESAANFAPGRHDDKRWTVNCGGMPLIAVVEQYEGRAEANARLIAAAPEMREALHNCEQQANAAALCLENGDTNGAMLCANAIIGLSQSLLSRLGK